MKPRTIVLPDGRRLTFSVFGDARGAPILAFHRLPGSHYDWRSAHAPALANGVCVVALDRGSAEQVDAGPGRWPADIEILADALGATAILLLGDGDGADFAIHCAVALPGQMVKVALVDPGPDSSNAEQGLATRTWLGPLCDDTYTEVFAWLRGQQESKRTDINREHATQNGETK